MVASYKHMKQDAYQDFMSVSFDGLRPHMSQHFLSQHFLLVQVCLDDLDVLGVKKVADMLWIWVIGALFQSTSRGMGCARVIEHPGYRDTSVSQRLSPSSPACTFVVHIMLPSYAR